MTEVVIAGSGQSGLLLARKLASTGIGVTCVERLPEPGGQDPEPRTHDMATAASSAGVKWLLGTLAMEYRDGVVSTLGVAGAASLPADLLVLATGTRPANRAQLRIAGDRGAGVLPGSAVHHYLDSGVLPGRYPIVLGDGELAETLCGKLLECGAASVTSIRNADNTFIPFPDTVTYWNSAIETVEGFPRVTAAIARVSDTLIKLPADSIVMAAGRIPMRNIENALFPRRRVIECFSSDDPKTVEGAERAATAAFNEVQATLNQFDTRN